MGKGLNSFFPVNESSGVTFMDTSFSWQQFLNITLSVHIEISLPSLNSLSDCCIDQDVPLTKIISQHIPDKITRLYLFTMTKHREHFYLWCSSWHLTLSLIYTFWHLCSRRLFENIVTKEEIAQNKQFLLLPKCFQSLVIGYPFNYRDFLFFDKICSKSSAAELLYEAKG